MFSTDPKPEYPSPTSAPRPGSNFAAEQLRLLSAALEAAANAIVITDKDGKMIWANQAFTKLTGYELGEVVGQNPNLLKSGKHEPEFYADMWKALLGGAVWEGEIINRKKDGSLYIEEATITPVRMRDGEISHFIAVKEDVTRRRQGEEALRRVKEANEAALAEMDAIVQSLTEGLIVADLGGNIVRANPAALRLLGFESEDQAHQSMLQYRELFQVSELDGSSVAAEDWPMSRALRGEVFSNAELRVRRKGSAEWMVASFSGAPVHDHNGNLIRAIVTVHDVTEIKRSEAVLRSRELQLIRTEKLAAAGRMAATIAHEINNPLAAVVNSVFLARSVEGLPDEAMFALKLAEQELARVTHITRQTLGFYNEPTEPKLVTLSSVLDEVLDLYGQKLKSKNINVKRKFADVTAFAVEGEFRQIVSNLITNSIDAVEPGGTIWVRIARPTQMFGQRQMAELTIADNGEGIRPENLKRIFEPFFTTKQAVGTGLGLWVTSELIKKHEGRLRIRSKPGMGTVVKLWLPTDRRRQPRTS